GKVQHFQQAVIRGKDRLGLGHLAQLAIKPLNGIGGVDQPAHLLGILEIGAEVGPIIPPGLGDFRVFLVPALPKGIQGSQGCLFVHGGIDRLQVGHKGLQVLIGHILAGIAQLVDYTVLDLGLRESGVNRRVKPRQIVGAGDENILYAPVFQAVEYSRPEFGALIFPNPHPQDVFPTIQVDSNGDVYGFLHDLPFAADMVVYGVQEYHSVDGFQGSLLPLLGYGQDFVCNAADRTVRDGNAVDVLDMGLDVTGGHPLGVHGQYFLFNVLADARLVLFQYLGIEFPLAISRDRYFHISKAGAQRFAAVAVAAVVCAFAPVVVFAVAQFVVQLCLQTILHEFGNGLLEQTLYVIHAADVCQLQ